MDVVAMQAQVLASWVRSLAILAAPAEAQTRWLDSLGPVADWNVDELALEFDDGHLLLPQWIDAGYLREAILGPAGLLDAQLARMSGEAQASLWTREALEQHESWALVRSLAVDVLCAID